MPLRSIVNTARALSFYTRRQEIAAHNLANVATDGYKGDRITARQSPGGPWPVPAQTLDLQQGNLRQTGRTLDVALEGSGFFVVKTKDGERLSRGGSFSLDAGGMLGEKRESHRRGGVQTPVMMLSFAMIGLLILVLAVLL